MEDFVAYPSPKKITPNLLGCVVLFGLGVWMAGLFGPPPTSSRFSSTFIVVIGWFSILAFGFSGLIWSRRLFTKRAHVRIGSNGFFSAQWSDQTIPWPEIEDVTTWTLKGQKDIILHLRDPTRFPGRGLAAISAGANRRLTGGDIAVSLNGTDRTVEEALASIARFRPSVDAIP